MSHALSDAEAPTGDQDRPLPVPPALLAELRQALQAIRYGTIELVIHNGQVVQLERREKIRFGQEVPDPKRP